MIHYVLTSPKFSGSVSFKFNQEEYLTEFSIDAEFSQKQFVWFYDNYPKYLSEVPAFQKQIKGNLTEVEPSLEFDDFWNNYGYKVGNKPRAKRLWEKLPKKQKLNALAWLKTYESEIARTNVAKLYPETYLSQQRWKN